MNKTTHRIFSIFSLVIALLAFFYIGVISFGLVLILCEYGYEALIEDVTQSTGQLWPIVLLLVLSIMTVVRALKDLRGS